MIMIKFDMGKNGTSKLQEQDIGLVTVFHILENSWFLNL